MLVIPFICLAIGIFIGLQKLSKTVLKLVDIITNIALAFLMLTIGLSIGSDKKIITSLPKIGINCLLISVFAIILSVIFTYFIEKRIVSLDSLMCFDGNPIGGENENNNSEEKKSYLLVILMPTCVILGIIFGYFFLSIDYKKLLDMFLTISLIVLYIAVGISQGDNKEVLVNIKKVGFKILYFPLAILMGSVFSGFISGILLKIPIYDSVLSASGMSFYSITGAYMSKAINIEAGTYGFIVNVMRELLTIVFLPLLIKISKGSPIASGAAGNMDTMLAPVTKFVGKELAIVTLITGTVLTFIVPFLLPILFSLIISLS